MIPLDAILLRLGQPPRRRKARWLHDGLAAMLADDQFAAGEHIPGSRQLARALTLSRGTVTEALDLLVSEGLLDAEPRRGHIVPARTRTAARRPHHADVAAPTHSPGVGDLSLFPRTDWLRSLRHALSTMPDGDLGYPSPAGDPGLRGALAGYLARTRGAVVDPGRVVIVAGSAQALAVLADLGRAESLVSWTLEKPHPPGMSDLLRRHGAAIRTLPVDADGIVLGNLPEPGFVLVTPANQAPTGVLLAPERRRALIAAAASAGVFIVEDDYDGDLPLARHRIGVLQAAAPESVFLLGSVSKSLAPGLRLGWVVVPEGWEHQFASERAFADLGSPMIDQAALAHFIESGAYDRHLRRVRKVYAERREALTDALRQMGFELADRSTAGLHVFIRCSEAAGRRIAPAVTAHDVPAQVVPGEPSGVVLGCATVRPRQARRVAATAADARQ
jgi:GntR family transcriptional regulator/MocR family aminotransferase